MPIDTRFPRATQTAAGAAELDQIITLAIAPGALELGGGLAGVYTGVGAWKTAAGSSPYSAIVVEAFGTALVTIGNGSIAQAIGLFGEIDGVGKYLLGVLGYPLGGVMPQLPVISATVGFAQIVSYAANYDKLSVGGIFGAISISEVVAVTWKVRPIRQRSYLG